MIIDFSRINTGISPPPTKFPKSLRLNIFWGWGCHFAGSLVKFGSGGIKVIHSNKSFYNKNNGHIKITDFWKAIKPAADECIRKCTYIIHSTNEVKHFIKTSNSKFYPKLDEFFSMDAVSMYTNIDNGTTIEYLVDRIYVKPECLKNSILTKTQVKNYLAIVCPKNIQRHFNTSSHWIHIIPSFP